VVAVAARGEQRRLVREVAEIGAGETGRGGRELLEAHVRRERTLPRVDLQDLGAALLVREIHDEAAIEAARPKQRAIEHVRLIRRREHDDALAAREAVHLREYLIERLLLLGRRAAENQPAACPPDRIELVDEDDRRRMLARLPEEI